MLNFYQIFFIFTYSFVLPEQQVTRPFYEAVTKPCNNINFLFMKYFLLFTCICMLSISVIAQDRFVLVNVGTNIQFNKRGASQFS